MYKKQLPVKLGVALSLLVVLLTGCSQTVASPASTVTSGTSPTSSAGAGPSTPASTPTTPPAAQSLPFNSPAAADLDGLHIQFSGLDCGAHPVLKDQPRSSYDSGTLNQIINYLVAFAQVTSYGIEKFQNHLSQLPPVPDSLQVVPGALDAHPSGPGRCVSGMDITNTGTESIQIIGIGITLTAPPVENPISYRLIDVCTFPQFSTQCGTQKGGTSCSYEAAAQLAGDTTGTHIEAPVISSDPAMCPTTVDPGQLLGADLSISSTVPNLIYQMSLTLTFSRAGETKTLTLPAAFTNTIGFADSSLISCYGLKGSTFVPVPYRYHPFIIDGPSSDGICE